MAENYYEILGVSKTASLNEIKIAFRKLALLYHPDKNPETKDFFVRILQAYEVLSNPVLREKYDKGLLSKNYSYSTNTNNKKENKNKWDVTEEDEKRRQYYKQHFEKLKREYEQERKKYEEELQSYKEWKYWLVAFIICFILFMLLIFSYR